MTRLHEDLGPLLGQVAPLLEVGLRPKHRAIVVEVQGVLGDESQALDVRVEQATAILKAATITGGLISPADPTGDAPWCAFFGYLRDEPRLRSWAARRWFATLEQLCWDDHEVSALLMAVAAYAVAGAEHDLGHSHERWWWMQMGSCQTEAETPSTLGLVAVLRARLLGVFPAGLP